MAMPPLASMSAKRRPIATVYARPAPSFLDLAGELLTAAIIIAGGVFAYGLMPTV